MLDTIKFRIYGILDTFNTTQNDIAVQNDPSKTKLVCPENHELYKRILAARKKNVSMNMVFSRERNTWENIDQTDFTILENSPKLSQHYQIRNVMRIIERGEQKEINLRIHGKYKVTSSSPDVTFSINENGSFIDFEFSIPKYLFGHNLAEFVPQGDSRLKNEKPVSLLTLKGQKKHLFKRLDFVIDRFLWDLAVTFGMEERPNKNYVEIRRLDLCYNQYFPTKEDALQYLEEQRKINMRRKRQNSNAAKDYDTAISYISSTGSYFKIYHKGSEYSKTGGDLKKHLDINKQYIDNVLLHHSGRDAKNYANYGTEMWGKFKARAEGRDFKFNKNVEEKVKETLSKIHKKMPYKVDFLKQEMDKVLRYEVSLKAQFFAYQYKKNVFRSSEVQNPIHQKHLQMYKDTKAKMKRLQDGSQESQITAYGRQNYQQFHNWLNKPVSLIVGEPNLKAELRNWEIKERRNYLNLVYQIPKFEYKYTVLGRKDVFLWNEKFLNICFNHFTDLIDYYQIKKMKPFDDICAKIREYNAICKQNREDYNRMNYDDIFVYDLTSGKRKNRFKGSQMITKATQLLTQKELREGGKKSDRTKLTGGMKGVNEVLLTAILKQMEGGKSMDQVFQNMGIEGNKKSRLKADLAQIGVTFAHIPETKELNIEVGYTTYYTNLADYNYRSKFFSDEVKHYKSF